MTAFTIDSGGTVLWDSLSGGSVNATLDTYAISNGSTLKIDTDSYQCANHSSAFGSLDTVSFSGTGGKLLIDGSAVRVVPFNTGSGTVPAVGTAVSRGGASGALLGVWANWLSEPLAAGAAMPATGFIKLRSVAGGAFTAGALTGISASATGPDVVGWIEVRGADTATITVPRVGQFETLGNWFELGLTTGVRGQVLPCPTTGTVAGAFPGVWIETAAGSGVFERYIGMGSRAASATDPTDERGKVCWQTTGGIRLGSDGTNNVGFLPSAGCRVRIPNVILTCCSRTSGSGSGPRVLPNATLATRQEFVTTASGDVQINYAVVQWYANFAQAYRANLQHCAVNDTLVLSEIASPLDEDDVLVAPTQTQANTALSLATCLAGGAIKNSTFARITLASPGTYVNSVQYCRGISFEGVRSLSLSVRGNAATGTWNSVQNADCTWTSCFNIGARALHTADQRSQWVNLNYADQFAGATTATNAHYAVEGVSGCSGLTVDGLTFAGLTNVHPYSGLVGLTACYDTAVRNIGSFAAPLSLGSANASGVIVNSAGNCAGIKLQRVYVSNTRTGPWAFVNSDKGVVMDNVFSDYADAPVLAALNMVARGCGCAPANTAQTAVYGTHWADAFTSATTGRVFVNFNEPNTETAAQFTIVSGTPKFNAAGAIALTVVGDQIIVEMPYFAKGHTAFANLGSSKAGTNTANFDYAFQYDLGAGYNGTWLNLNAANLSTVTGIDPAVGFRVKIRATCSTAGATNLLRQIYFDTITSGTAQSTNLYPLETYDVTFTGLPVGTDVVVLSAGTATVLAQVDEHGSASFTYTYDAAQTVDVGFIKTGYVPFYIRGLPLGLVDSSIPVALTADRNFA